MEHRANYDANSWGSVQSLNGAIQQPGISNCILLKIYTDFNIGDLMVCLRACQNSTI